MIACELGNKMISKISKHNNNIKYTPFTSKQVNKTCNTLEKSFSASKILPCYYTSVHFGNITNSKELQDTDLSAPTVNLKETITPTGNISAKDVINVLDGQLNLITAKQIEENLLADFDKSDQELALKALQYMCQFATMQSLNNLVDGLTELTNNAKRNLQQTGIGFFRVNDSQLFTDKDASLAANLVYFSTKKNFHFPEKEFKFDLIDFKNVYPCKSGSILLDENLYKLLNSNPDVLKSIQESKNITDIIYPEGWINGVNPFNQASLSDIKKRLETVVNRSKELQKEDPDLKDDQAIIKALNESIIKNLEQLGLGDRLKIVTNRSNVNNPTSADIEKLLTPNRMSEENLEAVLKTKIPQVYRQLVLKLLAKESHVYSPRTLSIIAQQQNQKIIETAQKKNIEASNIYYYIPNFAQQQNQEIIETAQKKNIEANNTNYYVPNLFKSFSFATMIYQVVNDIPPKQIINDLNDIPKKGKNMLVILDDFAGSGQTLTNISHLLYEELKYDQPEYPLECVLAPMVSTEEAATYTLEETKKIEKPTKHLNFSYCSGEAIKTLDNSVFYKSLEHKDLRLLEKILWGKGYRDNGLCVAFPHAGPDNNNYLFAAFVAPHYTLNQNGVRKRGYWKCPT